MILDGREALPLKFSLRASHAFSGEDFSSLDVPALRQALLATLNSIMERSGRPLLRPESIQAKFRPCGRDASGVLHTMYYALGVGCSKEEAGFLRHHVEATWGGALPLDLGRSAHALAMIYEGDDPLRGPYYLDITADAFGNMGPATALELLKLKGLKVSAVTEMACADGLLDPIASAPHHYNTICSVGPAPVEGDLGTHLVDRWPRPAAVSGEKRLVALVTGGESFVTEAMKQGGRVHVQVEQEDGSAGVQYMRIWRVWPTLPPRARPILTVARGAVGATGSGAKAEASPRQPPATGEASPLQPLSYKEVASAAASPRQAVAGMPTVAGSAGRPAASDDAAPAGATSAAQEGRHPAGEGQGQEQEGRRPAGEGQAQEGRPPAGEGQGQEGRGPAGEGQGQEGRRHAGEVQGQEGRWTAGEGQAREGRRPAGEGQEGHRPAGEGQEGHCPASEGQEGRRPADKGQGQEGCRPTGEGHEQEAGSSGAAGIAPMDLDADPRKRVKETDGEPCASEATGKQPRREQQQDVSRPPSALLGPPAPDGPGR